MARIKIQDYIKDVELNRQRLVNATGSDSNASLSSVVNTTIQKIHENNSNQEGVENTNLCEIRFFDGDGTLLKHEWIEKGGSVVPPEDPNLDGTHLGFVRWYSVIGNTFDNIQHDIDYGAYYNVLNNTGCLLCEFTEYTGLTVELPLYTYSVKSFIIDWGDNQVETITGTANYTYAPHTYDAYGQYTIEIKPVKDDGTLSTSNWYLYSSNYNLIGPTSDIYIHNALKGFYMPRVYESLPVGTDYVLDFAIYNSTNGSYGYKYLMTLYNVRFCVVPICNWLGVSGSGSLNLYHTRQLIIDKDWPMSHSYTITFIIGPNIDKLLLPKTHEYRSDSSIQYYLSTLEATSDIDSKLFKCFSYDNLSFSGNYYCGKNWEINLVGDNIKQLFNLNSVFKDLKKYTYPSTINYINSNAFTYMNIKNFTLPINCRISTSAFLYMTNLENLNIYSGFKDSMNLSYSSKLTIESILNILNNINITDQALTITFNSKLRNKLQNTYVKSISDIYNTCEINDNGSSAIIEIFNQKGWTISFAK